VKNGQMLGLSARQDSVKLMVANATQKLVIPNATELATRFAFTRSALRSLQPLKSPENKVTV
jgi:hypothetical protein